MRVWKKWFTIDYEVISSSCGLKSLQKSIPKKYKTFTIFYLEQQKMIVKKTT